MNAPPNPPALDPCMKLLRRPTVLFLALCVAACGKSESEPTPATSTATASEHSSAIAPVDSTEPVTQQASQSGADDEAEPAHASQPATSDDAVVLEEKLISDPARKDMAAYRLLVPKGWEVEGEVTKVPPAYEMIPTISDVAVRAPDGRGVRFWSMLEYGYADGVPGQLGVPYQGRPFAPLPKKLGSHWKRMFKAFPAEGVTKLRIVSEEVLEDATKELRKQLAPLYESTKQESAQIRSMGRSKEFDADVRKLVIRYTEDGEKIEATIFASLRKSIYRNFDGSIYAAMWNLDNMYAVFGPRGTDYTSDPVLAAIVRSRREMPEWQEAIQRWYLEKNQEIVRRGRAQIAAAARAAATTRSTQSQDVLDISFNGWKSRNSANDAGHSLSVNGIHERTTYVEPGGTTVDLPSYYQNVYSDGQGNYVLHDNANWNIHTDPGFNDRDWQRIEPRR